MDKRQRKLIAQFADKLEDDGAITESLYGIKVVRGNEPIDQLVHQIEMNFVDWDWNSKAFQKLMTHVYKGKPPTSPQELLAELKKSSQENALKQQLGNILLNTKVAAPSLAPAPAPKPQLNAPAPQLQAKPAPVAQQPMTKTSQAPRQQVQLQRGQTYTVVYENFRGQQVTFHNATFLYFKNGICAIFECPRPAGRPNPSWRHGKKLINNQQDVQNRKAELAQEVTHLQAALARLPNRRHRVHGDWYTLAQLKQQLPGWVRSIQTAEANIRRTSYSLNNSINSLTARIQQPMQFEPPVPMRKSLRVDRIISAK